MISLIPLFLVILGVVVVIYTVVGINSKNKGVATTAIVAEPIVNSDNKVMTTTKTEAGHSKNNIVATPTYQNAAPVSLGVWTGFKLGFGFAIGGFLATILIMLVFGFIFAGAIASAFAAMFSGFGF